MVDLFNFLTERRNIAWRHFLYDHKRKRALAEILHQLVLADDGVDLCGQIIQHIVIDARRRHAQHRWDHQQKRGDQHGNAVFYHRF